MKKSFTALEYHQDTKFYPADYRYDGSTETGWTIYRNGQPHLTLPRGYLMLETLCCGICSTDIARHHLPFPLPQITGHEVVVLHNGNMAVVDINASHKQTGEAGGCFYCTHGLENHCPDRLTLGIDRLPGGFAPYILVPQNAIIPLSENFDMKLASLIEPFAAALHAVETENIRSGDNVAIVGPRRLGGLLILALNLWRKKHKLNFTITAIVRSSNVRSLCKLAGADKIIDVDNVMPRSYDVVFDTSGSVSGFELALSLTNKNLHVKSTNGQAVFELKYLSEMVIDELSLLPLLSLSGLGLSASGLADDVVENDRTNIIVEPCLNGIQLIELKKKFPYAVFVKISVGKLEKMVDSYYRNFDAAIGASFDFINAVIKGKSLKPKASLFLAENSVSPSALQLAINDGININVSRCGNFLAAIALFQENRSFSEKFAENFVSEIYSISNLEDAFECSKYDKQAIKVLVSHIPVDKENVNQLDQISS